MTHPADHTEPDATPGSDAVDLAIAWLIDHHVEALNLALGEHFLYGLREHQRDRLLRLPRVVQALIDTNGYEQVVAEGILRLPDGPILCLDLLLGPGGPSFNPTQRQYLEALGSRAMSLYRVVEWKPGLSLRLRDLLDEGEPVRWVAEPLASMILSCQPGATFGGRLIPGDPWRLGRAMYPTQEPQLSFLLEQIRAACDAPEPPAPEFAVRSMMIIYAWLSALASTPLSDFESALREEVH